MKELDNLSSSEFSTLLSGANNKTCPESGFINMDFVRIEEYFINGIGFVYTCPPSDKLVDIRIVMNYIEKIKNEALNSNINNFNITNELLKRYTPVILLKILPRGERSKFLEVMPLSTYYEYINNCNEEEAKSKEKKFVKKYIV